MSDRMKSIGQQWTPNERLIAVGFVAEDLAKHPLFEKDDQLQDIFRRLLVLQAQSASFLEENKTRILIRFEDLKEQ